MISHFLKSVFAELIQVLIPLEGAEIRSSLPFSIFIANGVQERFATTCPTSFENQHTLPRGVVLFIDVPNNVLGITGVNKGVVLCLTSTGRPVNKWRFWITSYLSYWLSSSLLGCWLLHLLLGYWLLHLRFNRSCFLDEECRWFLLRYNLLNIILFWGLLPSTTGTPNEISWFRFGALLSSQWFFRGTWLAWKHLLSSSAVRGLPLRTGSWVPLRLWLSEVRFDLFCIELWITTRYNPVDVVFNLPSCSYVSFVFHKRLTS